MKLGNQVRKKVTKENVLDFIAEYRGWHKDKYHFDPDISGAFGMGMNMWLLETGREFHIKGIPISYDK
jgi:hypothetical protein